MKRILWIIAGIVLLTSNLWAEEPKSASTPAAKPLSHLLESFSGEILSVEQEKPDSKIKIGVMTLQSLQNQEKKEFMVPRILKIWTQDMQMINFSDLKKGDRLAIRYVVNLKGLNQVVTATKLP